VRRLRRLKSECGQATIEFLSATPVLLIAGLLVWQMCLVGIVLTSAQNAARTGARVGSRGGDGTMAARRALREPFRDGAEIAGFGGTIRVKVHVPLLIPGLDLPFTFTESAALPETQF
jgi:hypothetical protein